MKRFSKVLVVGMASLAFFTLVTPALAETVAPTTPGCGDWGCKAVATGGKSHEGGDHRRRPLRAFVTPSKGERHSRAHKGHSTSYQAQIVQASDARHRAIETKNEAIRRANIKAIDAYARQVNVCSSACTSAPVQPKLRKFIPDNNSYYLSRISSANLRMQSQVAAPAVPAVSPQQAAYMAVAKLKFPHTKPGIGPSPKINRWKMAAVGYPLWLWSAGPTHVGPVTDTVADLSVSLDAKVTTTVFGMGDGQSVTCDGAGTAWTTAVKPGEKSPSCGYAYQQPSLPKGDYTVTATTMWQVTWTVNDASGVIMVPRSSTTQLPVGELQALTR